MELIAIRHEKTGKPFITEASFSVKYNGTEVFIDLGHNRVMVTLGTNDIYPRVFNRDVSLIQILYYIRRALA